MENLEERLQEYEILDCHLNEENVMLKERIEKLDKQLAEGQGKKAFLAKRVCSDMMNSKAPSVRREY